MAAMEPAYTRRPDLYDIEHSGDTIPGEIAFYVELALRLGSPVLELGFGTGRVGLALARAGATVVGLDRSATMLEHGRQKLAKEPPQVQQRVTLVEADMRDFDLGQTFRLIYVPFRAFLHLASQADQRRALRCIHRHLADDEAVFAGNFFRPKPSLLEPTPDERLESVEELPDGGRFLRSYWTTGCDAHAQRKDIMFHSRLYDAAGRQLESRIDPLTLHWIHGREWNLLLEIERFELETLWGGFNGEPPDQGWEYVWTARRRS
jgi:SAM-dependent methyltransferase